MNKKNNSIGETSATNVTPPENTGNTSGGSTGGGNTATSGGESGIKPPIELMNVNHYVGYIKNVRDCMANAKAILDNYGIHTYGSSDKVFKLMVEANDGIVNYGNNSEQNYQNAIDCIDRHLEAGRPIIVGVNHTLKLKRNERTTDHFIVITGRGYDESHQAPYYTYIETARYLEKATEACDTQKNRIYYTSPPPLLQDNNTYFGENPPKYQITQVRPNDGNTIGTINSK